MKNFKNLTSAFFVLTALLFTACGSPVEEIPVEAPLTSEDFQVSTLAAEVGDKQVTLRGTFSVDEDRVTHELKWGFLWRVVGEDVSEMKKIFVGRGFEGTDFLIHTGDFPEGVSILACAFVETQLTENAETSQMAGEEVEFGF